MARAEAIGMAVKVFARELGVSPRAVRRAAHDGRLTPASVSRNRRGHLVILDPVKAKAEWAAHTRPRVDARTAGRSSGPVPEAPQHPLLAASEQLVGMALSVENALQAAAAETGKLPARSAWRRVGTEWNAFTEALIVMQACVRRAIGEEEK